MTKAEALALVTDIVSAYPRPEVHEDTVLLYVRHLVPLEYAPARAAVDRLILTSRFLPTIAEVRAAVTAAEVPSFPTAGDAWATVLHWVRKIGGYGDLPRHGTPVERMLCRAIDAIGGWPYLCHETDNLVADRAHFFRVWTEMATREERETAERVWPLPAPTRRPALPETGAVTALVEALVTRMEPPK